MCLRILPDCRSTCLCPTFLGERAPMFQATTDEATAPSFAPVARELRVLGVGSALGFAAVDFWFAGVRRRISRVYLADGVVELGLAAAWAYAAWRESQEARQLPEAAFA